MDVSLGESQGPRRFDEPPRTHQIALLLTAFAEWDSLEQLLPADSRKIFANVFIFVPFEILVEVLVLKQEVIPKGPGAS